MFDKERWYVVKFAFTINGNTYCKESFTHDYEINDATWEFDPDDTAIPTLIMSLVENTVDVTQLS